MRRIYIIGTIHNMFPRYKKELEDVLLKINPDQVLVEISSTDIKRRKFRKYPKEMVYSYKWALKKKKKVGGFDANIDVIDKKVSKKTMKTAESFAKKLYWKKANLKKNRAVINDLVSMVVDKKKYLKRQKQMLKNIRKIAVKEGKVLIITGAGHLSFFEKNIKNAIFPLRK